jgi:hypothetical protein
MRTFNWQPTATDLAAIGVVSIDEMAKSMTCVN